MDVLSSSAEPHSTGRLTAKDVIAPTPPGYFTVGQWWFENESGALDLLTDPALTFLQDADELQTMAERLGIPFYYVEASPFMRRELGHLEVRAFPEDLLRDFYAINP